MSQFVATLLFLLLKVVKSCDITATNDTNCDYAIRTSYAYGSDGDCSTSEIINKERLVLDVCIPNENGSIIMECVDGQYLRNKVYDETDCTGWFFTKYNGIDGVSECVDISCLGPVIQCDCIDDPCSGPCTENPDYVNMQTMHCISDCCDGIWYVTLHIIIEIRDKIDEYTGLIQKDGKSVLMLPTGIHLHFMLEY